MAVFGTLVSAAGGGGLAVLDTPNLNVTGTDLCLVAGAAEDGGSPDVTFTFVWDLAGANESMTDLGDQSPNNYLDADMAYLDDPTVANVPVRVTFSTSGTNGAVWAAFFTAAGDIVGADSFATLDAGTPTSVSNTVPNVVSGDVVIDMAAAADNGGTSPTFTPGADQTERLDLSTGAYTGIGVTTQEGVDGGLMSQTFSSNAAYGATHHGLRIPDAAVAPIYRRRHIGFYNG